MSVEVELYETLDDQAIGGFSCCGGRNNVLLILYDVVTLLTVKNCIFLYDFFRVGWIGCGVGA